MNILKKTILVFGLGAFLFVGQAHGADYWKDGSCKKWATQLSKQYYTVYYKTLRSPTHTLYQNGGKAGDAWWQSFKIAAFNAKLKAVDKALEAALVAAEELKKCKKKNK